MKITLKAARVNANLTQREAAEKLKITANTLANWEKGRSFPKLSKLAEIERLYMLSYDEILFLPKNST